MKILVISTMVPFVRGGAEELFDHLVRNLQATPGVEAEGFRIPFTWDPAERLLDEMLIARHLRLDHIDRVIALKFPAYLIPWPNKVLWLLHQYRQAYDLLDAGQSNIPADIRGQQIIAAIRAADNVAFSEAVRIHTNAPITSRRLLHYNKVGSSVLRPPLNDPELFLGGDSEGYILATGRINAGKRQHLLVRALRYAPYARLVVAGPPDTAADAARLRQLVREEGVESRVTLDLRFLPRTELAHLVNQALAVAYLPFDEDSLGYCTMEAFQAAKPVLSVTDAGGVLDIVRNGETGLVTMPDPEALGAALATLTANPGRAARLGRAGRAAMDAEALNWQATIEKLLA
ncbi:glycosyltransferase family 4 protein [Belnapia moabensis]|uniref:glycosyltransferase family 4 protein n=1 Tax=Belnapia moabensis TaxID=365533 RepID=UPI0005B82C36|nr:glycosyltransferase family 4 protein [Belnapia moabensis]